MVKGTARLVAAAFTLIAATGANAAPTEQFLPFKFTTTLPAGTSPTFRFSLYDTPTPGTGTEVWYETRKYKIPATKTIAHVLGSRIPFGAPLPAGTAPGGFSRQLWIQVIAGTFIQRYKLTMAPYALWSARAGTLSIACSAGQTLVADGEGNWACSTPQQCVQGDQLSCYHYPAGPSTQGVGQCKNGTRSCVSGAWSQSCVGQVTPEDEVCDGLDNDCDGVLPDPEIDEDGDGFMVCGGDCDDANTLNGDGCSPACIVEQGYQCTGQPSVCTNLQAPSGELTFP